MIAGWKIGVTLYKKVHVRGGARDDAPCDQSLRENFCTSVYSAKNYIASRGKIAHLIPLVLLMWANINPLALFCGFEV